MSTTIIFTCEKCNTIANTAIHIFDKFAGNIYIKTYDPGASIKHILHPNLKKKLITRLHPIIKSSPYSISDKEIHLCVNCYNIISYIAVYEKMKNEPALGHFTSYAKVSSLTNDTHAKYFKPCDKKITFENIQQLKEVYNDKFVVYLNKLNTEELVEIKSGFGVMSMRKR